MRRAAMTVIPLFAVLALACDTGRKGSAGFRLPDGDPVKGKQVFLESRIVAMSFCEPRSWTRVLSS